MEALRGAEQIAVALPALCEFVWVLRRVYAFPVAAGDSLRIPVASAQSASAEWRGFSSSSPPSRLNS